MCVSVCVSVSVGVDNKATYFSNKGSRSVY